MTATGGQYKLLFGEGMKLTVISGEISTIFHFNYVNLFVNPKNLELIVTDSKSLHDIFR